LRVVGAVVFVDSLFYAAIAPLLPALAKELGLSKLSAGVLTASYGAGMLISSLPAGVVAVRIGPKSTVFIGLTLLGGSTLAFGLLDSVAGLCASKASAGLAPGPVAWPGSWPRLRKGAAAR